MISKLLVGASLAAATAGARAQWTVVSMHPPGATTSVAFGVGGGQQVGGVNGHASLWNGPYAPWLDLNPAGAYGSTASDLQGEAQVGWSYVLSGAGTRASLWSGTAASWVDLNPVSSTASYAYAIDGPQLVGIALIGGVYRASLWTGSAASWVDLSPPGSTWASAEGVHNGVQAGFATVGSVQRASLWTGSAGSWVDLSPAGSTHSAVHDLDGAQQVGEAVVGGVSRASLWTGSAGSWVDLSPPDATYSSVGAVHGGEQAGYLIIGTGHVRAAAWAGTADSWTDLHALLPPAYYASSAEGVSHTGYVTYVVGWGVKTGPLEAFMWVRDPCWTGILQPINADGSSIFRLGSTVLIRFQLSGPYEGITTIQPRLYLAQVSGGVAGTEVEAVSNSAADSGNTFRYAGGQYIFNLGTRGLAAGTWRLRIDMNDGVERTVLISLR